MKAKIFIGYLQNSEIRVQLQQSSAWKYSQDTRDDALIQVTHQAKDYIGLYVSNPIDFENLKINEELIKQRMATYCPTLNIEKYQLHLFPQLFIS